MIQLKVLSGKKAGTTTVARRFPVRIGRDPGCELCLEEAGVWEQHLVLSVEKPASVALAAEPKAITSLNGERVEKAILRNGDILEVGSTKVQFLLGETRQRGLALREWLIWALIAGISLGQIAVVYLLLDA